MTDRVEYGIGDRVTDIEAEEADQLVVLDPNRGPAATVEIPALDATVAAVNPSYSADDPVVRCIHVTWLDRNVGDRWRTWQRTEIPHRLRNFAAEWSLNPKTYDYPQSRLQAVEEPDTEPGGRESPQTRMDEWMP